VDAALTTCLVPGRLPPTVLGRAPPASPWLGRTLFSRLSIAALSRAIWSFAYARVGAGFGAERSEFRFWSIGV